MVRKLFWIILVLFILAIIVKVSHERLASPERAKTLVESKLGNVVVIDKTFSAIDNLQGFVVHFKNSPTDKAIVYADKEGRYLVIGNILDNKGTNLTMQETSDYIRSALNQEAYLAAQKLNVIWQGSQTAKHVVTIAIDPNSPLFPQQYESLANYVDKGELAIRWVLVNYLKPFGAQTAAAILQAPDPVMALTINAEKYHYDSQTGGISPTSAITTQSKQTLQDNWNFMQLYKFSGTPVALFKTQDGKIYVVQGILLDEMLASVVHSVKGRDTEEDQPSS